MTTSTWLEILGWTGSAVLVVSLLQSRVLLLRAINLAGSVLLVAYNFALSVWPMVGLNTVLAAINVVFLVRMTRTKDAERSYEILEVPHNDVVMRRFLHNHDADIRRFNPHLDPAALVDAAPDNARHTLLIMRTDEVVGVLVIRPEPGMVGVVELDYVTIAYRDLHPGQFLFRESTMLVESGFRHIRIPEGIVSPYYGRIGFREGEDGWTLDLEP